MEYLHDINTNTDYAKSVTKYLLQRDYNNTFGDLVPVILANALSKTIRIKNVQTNNEVNDIVISPMNGHDHPTIVIHRAADHYSGVNIIDAYNCIPSEQSHSVTKATRDSNSQKIKYTRSELMSLNSSLHKIRRQTRKSIFKNGIWMPALYRSNSNKNSSIMNNASHRSCNNLISVQLAKHAPTPLFLKICVWNACSLNNKIAELCDIVLEKDLDVFAITESWLQGPDKTNPTVCQIKNALINYEIVSCPRKDRKGGGIFVIYKKSLSVKRNMTSTFFSFEHLDLTLNTTKAAIRLITIYRPPQSVKNKSRADDFFSDFTTFLETLTLSPGHLIIVGDFNFHIDVPENTYGSRFLELLHCANLSHLVHEPTHRSGHTLDNVITRSDDDIISRLKIHHDMPSDHAGISFFVSTPKPEVQTMNITKRNIRGIDRQSLNNDIYEKLVVKQVKDIDILANEYSSTLNDILNKHAPPTTKVVRVRHQAKWYTNEIRQKRTEKRKSERLWKKTGLHVHRAIFKDHCHAYYKLVKAERQKYYQDKIQNGDQKSLFKFINNMTSDSAIVLPSYSVPKDLANKFSNFFNDKIMTIRKNLNLNNANESLSVKIHENCTSQLLSFQTVTQEEVSKLIGKAPSKSCQLDPIPTFLVKECLSSLLPFITHMINQSISSGKVPRIFKQALVKPLIKKPTLDAENLQNYRPVANLSFISKVLERIIANQLHVYLEKNDLHERMQSAYRPKHSTETALLKIQNDVLLSLDKGNEVILVFLDLSAAFDTIDHFLLLERLRNRYGLTGLAWDWIKSYLENREQYVVINDKRSSASTTSFGVPQGSVLGPIMFILYTAPLGDIIRAHGMEHTLYADDTQLYISVKPSGHVAAAGKIEACLKDIRLWMQQNKLKLNDSKTELLHATSKHKVSEVFPSVSIGESKSNPVAKVRNLGVILDKNFTMTDHIHHVTKTASHHIWKIGKIRKMLDRKSTETLVHAFVTSRLDYCNSLLIGLPSHLIKQLQRIQNTAARVVTKTKKFDHVSHIMRDLHWLPVRDRIVYKVLILTFKALHGEAPNYISNMVIRYVPPRNLRSSSKNQLEVPKVKTKLYGERAFAAASPNLWNSLPKNITNCDDMNVFKSMLKTFLFSNAYK